VYSGGSALELFDSNIEVIGGVDDITVDSIFGGLDEATEDTSVDEALNVTGGAEDTPGGEALNVTGGAEDTPVDEALNATGGADEDSKAIITSIDIALPVGTVEAPIVSSVNIPIQVPVEKKDTVTASDVASLLSSFI
jgi:hypothetical protein